MKRTKLPTTHDQKCRNCKAIIIKSYDYFNGVYKYKCGNCGQTRYEPSAKFEARFPSADKL